MHLSMQMRMSDANALRVRVTTIQGRAPSLKPCKLGKSPSTSSKVAKPTHPAIQPSASNPFMHAR